MDIKTKEAEILPDRSKIICGIIKLVALVLGLCIGKKLQFYIQILVDLQPMRLTTD